MANVLIIEDDRDLVNSLRMIFESKKYNLRTAYNGKEGYEQTEKRKPDIIILDVMMATDTEGFDLAYKLKNKPEYRNVPITLVTGFTQRLAELGSERFQHIFGEDWPASKMFEKPTDPAELLEGRGQLHGHGLTLQPGRKLMPIAPGGSRGNLCLNS